MFLPELAPNNALQLTASSVRSCVAPLVAAPTARHASPALRPGAYAVVLEGRAMRGPGGPAPTAAHQTLPVDVPRVLLMREGTAEKSPRRTRTARWSCSH